MTVNALYTDLSQYYDLMCSDIDYHEQSAYVLRLHELLGNGGRDCVDLACGTGPHLRHFIDWGYQATGVDINQPMLDLAQLRCSEATFLQQDMSELSIPSQVDLITCFLYSMHYNQSIEKLRACFSKVHGNLRTDGMFCFNAVDKSRIDNRAGIKRRLHHEGSDFSFQSNWFYSGKGDQQQLQLSIEKSKNGEVKLWRDHHSMVAVDFKQLQKLLLPYFDLHIFNLDYQAISPWDGTSGNAIFVGIKR